MTTIHVTWDANPADQNLTGYAVFGNLNGGAFSQVATVPASQLFYDNPSPSPGVYNYFVKAVNLAGSSPQSATVSSGGVPSAPQNVALSVIVT